MLSSENVTWMLMMVAYDSRELRSGDIMTV